LLISALFVFSFIPVRNGGQISFRLEDAAMNRAEAEIEIVELAQCMEAVPTIAGWIHNEWASLTGRTFSETLERFANPRIENSLPITLLALHLGNPVGVASLRQYDDPVPIRDVTPWIANVFVVLEYRGRGIASRLMHALLSRARGLGYSSVWLATPDQQSLYRRCGFEVERSLQPKDHTITDIMRLDFSRS
jgi:GNAT superfamily N-acetyltransferase